MYSGEMIPGKKSKGAEVKDSPTSCLQEKSRSLTGTKPKSRRTPRKERGQKKGGRIVRGGGGG